jgi:hypothetical protein
MKRLALKLVLFLLVGAIINVAVAWGCALVISPNGFSSASWQSAQHADYAIWQSAQPAEAPRWPGWVYRSDTLGAHFLAIASASMKSTYVESYVFRQRESGWPMYSCGGSAWYKYSRTTPGAPWIVLEVHPHRAFILPRRIIPTGPIWKGFTIDTLLYAALLWMVFVVPGTLRRLLRVRHSLCPGCGYPIGLSAVCTECGETVNP